MNLNFQPTSIHSANTHDPHQGNLSASIHRSLRGRYLWAVILAVVLGACGAIGGYKIAHPLYTSNAYIQIHPKLSSVLYEIEETRRIDMFDSVASAEASFVQSGRVLEQAVENEDLLNGGWPAGIDGVEKLQDELNVARRRGEQIITLGITDVDPRLAMLAVNAILKAYTDLHGDEESTSITTREQILQNRLPQLQLQLENSRNRIQVLSERFGTDDLDPLHDAKLNELLELKNRLSEVDQRLVAAEALPDAPNDEETADPVETGQAEEYSIETLMSVDPQIAKLIARRNDAQATLEAARADYGPAHIQIRNLERDLSSIKSQIATRAEELRQLIASGQLDLSENQLLGGLESIESLRAMKVKYESMLDAVTRELKDISDFRMQIASLNEEQARTKRFLDTTLKELESIRVESSQILRRGRITSTRGIVPPRPSVDRRKQLAVLGGLAGFSMGVGAIWLIGVLKPSYRYIDELEDAHSLPLLGTLPDLSDSGKQELSMASLSIHHLRNLLSLRKNVGNGDSAVTYMITSAQPGDGKTSLSLALGMSFASEGMRTIMIDVDLVGRGLSRALDLDGQPGFTDALGAELVNGQIHSTYVSDLWMMPAGRPGGCRPEELSAAAFRQIVEITKKEFDIILIDTGPLMGSLEANLAASIADETILTVSRGQNPNIVRAALNRLQQIGGRCAGLVFNRASQDDLAKSVSQISFQSQSIRPPAPFESNTSETDGETGQSTSRQKALVQALMNAGANSDSGDVDSSNVQ